MKTINNDQDNVTLLTELSVEVCEFMKTFRPVSERYLIGERRQRPFCSPDICGIMTILTAYQMIGGQNFRQYCRDIILQFHRKEFPDPVSYQRFVGIAPIAAVPLSVFLKFRTEMIEKTGPYAIGSTPLCVYCQRL